MACLVEIIKDLIFKSSLCGFRPISLAVFHCVSLEVFLHSANLRHRNQNVWNPLGLQRAAWNSNAMIPVKGYTYVRLHPVLSPFSLFLADNKFSQSLCRLLFSKLIFWIEKNSCTISNSRISKGCEAIIWWGSQIDTKMQWSGLEHCCTMEGMFF